MADLVKELGGTAMQLVGMYMISQGNPWGYALMVSGGVYGAEQQKRKAEQKRAEMLDAQKRAYNDSLQDRMATRVAADSPAVFVYGRARVGSTIVAIFTSGAKDEYKHLVCVHAAHECDAFEEIYINGKALGALDGNGDVTGGEYFSSRNTHQREVKTGISFDLLYVPTPDTLTIYYQDFGGEGGYLSTPYTLNGTTVTLDANHGPVICTYQSVVVNSAIRVKKHLGTASDPADAALMEAVPDKWFSTSVLRGYCYTYIRLDLNEREFQGGLPTVEALLRGKKLYDPRSQTTYWSRNPALVIRDYLTSEICGVDAADLPSAQFTTAASVCEEAVTGLTGGRYTFNGTVTAAQDPARMLEQMAQSMAGWIVSTTWDIAAGKYVAPVLALDQADIVGDLAITPGASDADIYNGVRGQYISSETLYVATDFKPYQNAAYLAADGSELWTNLDFPFTDSVQRVHNLARIFAEDHRNGYTVKAGFSMKAWGLRVGDRVTLTSALFGWSAKIFRVTGKTYSPTSPVVLTLKEDAATIWDEADAVVADATPNTNLPDPFYVPVPTSLTASTQDYLTPDGTQKTNMLISCADASNVLVDGYEFGYKLSWNADWLSVVSGERFIEVPDVVLGPYAIRVRALTSMGRSAWAVLTYTAQAGATITVPPIDALNAVYEGTTLWLNWLPVTDARRLVYEVRCGDSWGSGSVYQAGSQTRFKVIKDGTWWVAARTVSGVYSLPKGIHVENAVLTGNVLAVTSEADTSWKGDKSAVWEYTDGLHLAGTTIFSTHPSVAAVPGIVNAGGFAGTGVYTVPAANRVDIGVADACQFSAALDYDVLDPMTQIGAQPIFSALPSIKCPLGGTGSVLAEMNLAGTDGIFTGWQPFMPGSYFARLFDFRVKLSSTAATVTPIVSDIVVTVDVPDRIESAQVTTPSGPLAVLFPKAFNAAPKIQTTILSASAGDDAVLSNVTETGFTLLIKNAGSNVARSVNYLAQGY